MELSAYLLPAAGLHGVYKNYFIIRDLRFSERWSCSRLDVGCLASDVSKYSSATSIFWVEEFQIGYGRITILPNVCNYLPNVAANIPTTRSLCPPSACKQPAVGTKPISNRHVAISNSRITNERTEYGKVSRVTCHHVLWQPDPEPSHVPLDHTARSLIMHRGHQLSAGCIHHFVIKQGRTLPWRLRFRRLITCTDFLVLRHRQCMQNVTFRRFKVTIVAVERQLVLHILSVCLQP